MSLASILLSDKTSKAQQSDGEEEIIITETTLLPRHRLAHPKGGICLHDEGGIVPQATKDLVAKVASKLIKAQFSDILKIGTPAFVHSSSSYLECAAMDMRNCSRYLTKAAETSDPILRLKLITSMYIAGQHISPEYCQMRAPLNPILGETLQREMADGTRLYME